jgi:ribosomal protein S18 acetylase RimI-like enzyme
VGILLQNLFEFDANAYQNSSPLLIPQLCRSIDALSHMPTRQQLMILTNDQVPSQMMAGMIVPKNDRSFLLADWPVAESWHSAEKILTAYAEHVRSQNSDRPILLLREDVGDSEHHCGPFRLLTTIISYIYSFPENQSTPSNKTHAGESVRIVNVPIDDADTLQLLEEIGQDSRDCPELQSIMDWETRLADYRDSEGVSTISVRQLVHDDEPIGVAVWVGFRRSNRAELKFYGIRPERRHQGWGTRFLDVILSELQKQETDCLSLHVDSQNDFAIKLYENRGLEKTEQRGLWLACQ